MSSTENEATNTVPGVSSGPGAQPNAPRHDGPVSIDDARRPRRWRPIVAAVAGVGLLVGGLWWVGSKVSSPEQRAAEAAAPVASPIGVPVEFRVLRNTIITRGDVKPAGAVNVVWTGGSGAGAAAGIVTNTPHAVGEPVAEGQPVVEVAGRPVFLVSGTLPIYRDLVPGSTGDDVKQLQDVLARLGFDPGEHDGLFGSGTKVAVDAWFRAAGYEPVLTSKDAAVQLSTATGVVGEAADALTAAQAALVKAGKGASDADLLEARSGVDQARRALSDARSGQVAQVAQAQAELDTATTAFERAKGDPTALPADVDAAKIAVVTAQAAFDQARTSTASAVANAQDALKISEARFADISKAPDVTEAQTTVDAAAKRVLTAQAAYDALDKVTGVMVPAAEVVVIPSAPATVAALNVAVGAKADGTLVTLTSSGLIVEALLDVSAAQLVQPGAKVTIDSELAGETRSGTLTTIATDPVVPTDQNGGQSGYPATILTDEALGPEWLGRNVRVTITNASTTGETLVVPEAAVYAQADGTTKVTKLDPGTLVQTDVVVTVGLTASGFAAITPGDPAALQPDDLVVVGTQAAGAPPTSVIGAA